jgi:predicted phosphoribosyltransferase
MRLPLFSNRTHAGQRLARALQRFAGRGDVTVLAIPHGGVLVASEVARTLRAPLDVFLPAPIIGPQDHVTLGSVAWPPAHQLHDVAINALRLSEEQVRHATAHARLHLRQRLHALRPLAPAPVLHGRTVLLVDEGVAQGLLLHRAAGLVRRAGARTLVAAVPVGARAGLELLADAFDDVVCLREEEHVDALAALYADFPALSDAEVRDTLARAWRGQNPLPEAPQPQVA